MLYIDHTDGDKYFVADTDDGAIDVVSSHELMRCKSQGIDILGWSQATQYITASMNSNNIYKLWRKLQRNGGDDEVSEYLTTHTVYTLADIMNKSNVAITEKCKVFNYGETEGYYGVVLEAKPLGKIFMVVTNENRCYARYLNEPLTFKKYPSCSGSLITRLLWKNGYEFNVPDDCFFMLYNDVTNELVLINQYRLAVNDYMIRVQLKKGDIIQ